MQYEHQFEGMRRKVSCSEISNSILIHVNFYRYRDIKISPSKIYLDNFCQLEIVSLIHHISSISSRIVNLIYYVRFSCHIFVTYILLF